MKQEQFTPGPWTASHGANYFISIGSLCTHTNVCNLPNDMEDHGSLSENAEETKANANLIAAAPDMYEALKEVSQTTGFEFLSISVRQMALAALNKANP